MNIGNKIENTTTMTINTLLNKQVTSGVQNWSEVFRLSWEPINRIVLVNVSIQLIRSTIIITKNYEHR